MSLVVEPISVWAWMCPSCGHLELMQTIGDTEAKTLCYTCNSCEQQWDVQLPLDLTETHS